MNDQSKDFSCSWQRLIVNILHFLSFIISLAYQNLAYYVTIRLIICNVNMTHMLHIVVSTDVYDKIMTLFRLVVLL